jgi:hypothetical protein
MKTVFDILDGLAEQHPTDLELKRSYEDIKTYFRYRAYVRYLANANAVLADTKAKQGQVLWHSSSHTKVASLGEENTWGMYNISVPDRTNQSVDAAGRPTVDYGKTIAGNSGSESFDMASVERGRQLFNRIPSRSLDTVAQNSETLVSPSLGSITVPKFENQLYRDMITKNDYVPYVVGILAPSQFDPDRISVHVGSPTSIILYDMEGKPTGTIAQFDANSTVELLNKPKQFANGYWGVPTNDGKNYVLLANISDLENIGKREQVIQKMDETLTKTIDVENLKVTLELIENEPSEDAKILHAALLIARLRSQQYDMSLQSNNWLSVFQKLGDRYDVNVDFTSTIASSKVDMNIWRQALLASSPLFAQFVKTKTDTQGKLKDPNVQSQEFTTYLSKKYNLREPIRREEIMDIKRDPAIDPADKSILMSSLAGGIPKDTSLQSSVASMNEFQSKLAQVIWWSKQGHAQFFDSTIINALNGNNPQGGHSQNGLSDKWMGPKKEWDKANGLGDFLSNMVWKNQSWSLAIYAILVGLITWWGGKDGKFGRFFFSALAIPFAPAAIKGIEDIFAGDPETKEKMKQATKWWLDSVMKNENADVKSHFTKMVPRESPEQQQQIDKANQLLEKNGNQKRLWSYQEHIAALGWVMLDVKIHDLFFSSDSSQLLRSDTATLPGNLLIAENIHKWTMKRLLRQLILGDPANPQDKKYMNGKAIDQATIDTWLKSKNLDQTKMQDMTLRQLVQYITTNNSK